MISKLTIAALGLIFVASVNAMKNEPTGFRGIEWGASASSVQGLIEVSDQEVLQHIVGMQLGLNVRFPLKTYVRQEDKREFDGTPVVRTTYIFYRDQFMTATITYKSSMGIHPHLGQQFPNHQNEAEINRTLTKNFGDSDYNKLSFFEKLKPSNAGLPSYSGETTEINNKCVEIGNHGQQVTPPWLYNCELQFRSSALYKQSKRDFTDYLNQSKANRDDTIAEEKTREQSKPDF